MPSISMDNLGNKNTVFECSSQVLPLNLEMALLKLEAERGSGILVNGYEM